MSVIGGVRDRLQPPTLIALTAVAAAAVLGASATHPHSWRVMFGGLASLLFLVAALARPRAVLLATLALAPFIGLLRRLASVQAGSVHYDPILLVIPIAVIALFVAALGADYPRHDRSRLEGVIVIFQILVALECLNPEQGHLLVGAGGILFLLVPTLWFWIGQRLVDLVTLKRLLLILLITGVATAAYALVQDYSGFPPWDQRWVASAVANGYAALYIGTSLRIFSTFNAASEFAIYMGVSLSLAVTYWRRSRAWLWSPVILLCGWALILSSSRTPVVLAGAAVAVVLAARFRLPFMAVIIAVVGAMFGISAVAAHFLPSASNAGNNSNALVHQLGGLAHPFNPYYSTASVHYSLFLDGLKRMFKFPLGVGSGAITLSADRFGTGNQASEVDPSNVATALGIPGFVLYVMVVALALRLVRNAVRDRSPQILAVSVLVIATFFEWLTGANYSIAPLAWLGLGILDNYSTGKGYLVDPRGAVVAPSRAAELAVIASAVAGGRRRARRSPVRGGVGSLAQVRGQ